jgi:hypothetical protein
MESKERWIGVIAGLYWLISLGLLTRESSGTNHSHFGAIMSYYLTPPPPFHFHPMLSGCTYETRAARMASFMVENSVTTGYTTMSWIGLERESGGGASSSSTTRKSSNASFFARPKVEVYLSRLKTVESSESYIRRILQEICTSSSSTSKSGYFLFSGGVCPSLHDLPFVIDMSTFRD